ncbi:P-type DNA transfer ATPase VirB11 [Devosia sp. BK]|uniref:P-type DNA transfer ATPase VirB11 n=1 Tax=Devosia sp. BK TaxID=2871706 RepID=UPI00293A57AF|nr:P-type DNA transfer ATPase VirB11 [Devosia sp. BK]MDV3253530.1 P-type DNA transfer ATPase VirB11 [Devosia sp. BK]
MSSATSMLPTLLYVVEQALEPLRSLLDDPAVVEISVNKPGQVFVERIGQAHMEFHSTPAMTAEAISQIAQRVAAYTNQFVNSERPLLSAALPTGERIQVVLPPAAPDGGTLSIRKQVTQHFTLEEYRDNGSLDKVAVSLGGLSQLDHDLIGHLQAQRIYEFLDTAIRNRVSILISGGTSTGKTTFLNACLKSVDPNERILTLEDTRELFPTQKNVVHLIASKGDQGTANVTIQSLLESSLRMRPDRLFVGEIRGAEAFTFLRAINTGHPGSMSTVHADTPQGAYEQLVMMIMQGGMVGSFSKADLLSYLHMVIPVVIQLRRDGGKRGVSEIFFARQHDHAV